MMKKIVIFIPSIENGGVEKNAIWLANNMAQYLYVVDIVYVRAGSIQLDKLDDKVNKVCLKGKKYKFIHPRLNDIINVRREFGNYLRLQNKKETVVVSFQSSTAIIGICRKHRVKIICRLSNHPIAAKYENSIMRKIAEKLKPYSYKKADCVVANSKQVSMDFGKLINKEVEVIYNPIDLGRIELLKKEPIEDVLQEESAEYEGRLIVSVGRLVRQKDYLTLIDGLSMSKYREQLKLWIIGEGVERKNILDAITKNGLEKNVRLLGYKQNVYSYLAHGSIFIQTSLYEGCPNSLIEATAVGIPTIATDCLSGPREVLMDGIGGKLVGVRDANAVAQAIDEFVENPSKYEKMKEQAYSCVSRYSASNTMKKYLEVINSV